MNLRFGVLVFLPWSGWILTQVLAGVPAPYMDIDVVSLARQCSPSCSSKTQKQSQCPVRTSPNKLLPSPLSPPWG